jgi:hypothetical protein
MDKNCRGGEHGPGGDTRHMDRAGAASAHCRTSRRGRVGGYGLMLLENAGARFEEQLQAAPGAVAPFSSSRTMLDKYRNPRCADA